jgi:hypothetical protein
MTTVSLFGVQGPFTTTNTLPHDGNGVPIVDKVTGNNLVLPRGNVVTELSVRRRGTLNDPNLTSGKSVAVGLQRVPAEGDPVTDPRKLTGTPGVLTDDLNAQTIQVNGADDPFRTFNLNLNATTQSNNFHTGELRDRVLVSQCAMGAEINSGALSYVIKYKPFSGSVARRHNV